MIAFDLQCAAGHCFEGWFEDRKAYEYQKKKGLIACPVCNDASISQVLSPVAIKSSSPPKKEMAEVASGIRNLHKQVSDYIRDNFDDVGHEFAAEALKIHYGAAEPRNIRGVSTKDEEKELKKEGIEFFKLPVSTQRDSDT